MKIITVNILGMHCANCALTIQNTLAVLPGVQAVQVNFASEQAVIEYNETATNMAAMNETLGKFGYSLLEVTDNINVENDKIKKIKLAELTKQRTKIRIFFPLSLIIILSALWMILAQYFSAIPPFVIPEKIFNISVFIIATVVFWGLGMNFIKAVPRFIARGQANMDTLVGLGTGVAYIYSLLVFFLPKLISSWNLPNILYFDVVIVVITFVYLGKYLEARAKLRTSETIEKLLELQVKSALVLEGKAEIEKPLEDIQVGDIVIVKPGGKIPIDGEVIFGESSVNEALITGESLPQDKAIGALVIGGTVNLQGVLHFKVTKNIHETLLANIIKLVERAQNSKAPIQRLADRVARIFVPVVLLVALLSFITWLTIGSLFLPWATAFSLGITCFVSVLVIACPCALGLATPTGVIVGVGLASRYGILVKNAESLEKLGKITTIVMDKTGTLTKGEPTVAAIIGLNNATKENILTIAVSLEKSSEHPLAKAIIEKAAEQKITPLAVEKFQAWPGQGITGQITGQKYYLGNARMLEGLGIAFDSELIQEFSGWGQTPLILADESKVLGIIAVADVLKENALESVKILQGLGLKVIMLTGDHRSAADYIGRAAQVDEIIAEALPATKAEKITALKYANELVAMVGDGVNDSVALSAADIGIAMANGSDIAIEAADITILHGDLSKIITAIKISRLTMKKIRQNLFWAFFYNLAALPIAAGLLYPFFGLLLNPAIAALAMSLSSVSVVTNSLLMKRARF